LPSSVEASASSDAGGRLPSGSDDAISIIRNSRSYEAVARDYYCVRIERILHQIMCDRVRSHTHDSRRNSSFFYFILFILLVQQRCCSDGGYIIISPSPRSHLTDEVRWRRVANQRVARGLWAAFLRGGGGVVQRLLPRDDMKKLGSCPSLLQPPYHIQITPVIWVGISKGIRGYPSYYNWGVVPGVLSDALAILHFMLTVIHIHLYAVIHRPIS